jgi:hypothetical protein
LPYKAKFLISNCWALALPEMTRKAMSKFKMAEANLSTEVYIFPMWK